MRFFFFCDHVHAILMLMHGTIACILNSDYAVARSSLAFTSAVRPFSQITPFEFVNSSLCFIVLYNFVKLHKKISRALDYKLFHLSLYINYIMFLINSPLYLAMYENLRSREEEREGESEERFQLESTILHLYFIYIMRQLYKHVNLYLSATFIHQYLLARVKDSEYRKGCSQIISRRLVFARYNDDRVSWRNAPAMLLRICR